MNDFDKTEVVMPNWSSISYSDKDLKLLIEAFKVEVIEKGYMDKRGYVDSCRRIQINLPDTYNDIDTYYLDDPILDRIIRLKREIEIEKIIK